MKSLFQHLPVPSKVIWALIVASLASLTSCEEPPEACYTVDATLVDVNAPVTFTNCTEPVAASFTWDFGDGSTSTDLNPVHSYTAEGQYIASLNTQGDGPNSDDVFKTIIQAGQRIFASAQIESLPTTNTQGGPWDATDNPDIVVRFATGGNTAYQSIEMTDVALTFPITIPTPANTLVLSPAAWTITVIDMDGGSEEVMATFNVDLASFVPNTSRTIPLSDIGNLTITYSLR